MASSESGRVARYTPLTIRRAEPSDHEAIWQIFHEVAAGDTYRFDP